jgi:hypothetical protein
LLLRPSAANILPYNLASFLFDSRSNTLW